MSKTETTVIYIPTLITEEVKSKLEDNKLYFTIAKNGTKHSRYGYDLKSHPFFTHILLPKEITLSDIEKEAYRRFPLRDGMGGLLQKNMRNRIKFRDGINWLLSITETK